MVWKIDFYMCYVLTAIWSYQWFTDGAWVAMGTQIKVATKIYNWNIVESDVQHS